MIRAFGIFLVLLALMQPATAQTPPAGFRIGIEGLTDSGCTATPSDAAAAAYRKHLEGRLGKPVVLCSYADGKAVATALQDGQLDLAVLDQPSFEPVSKIARPILAPRADAITGRVLAVALTLKTSGRDTPVKLAGSRPIFISKVAASHQVPLQGLADFGADTKSFKPELFVADEQAGLAALRAGQGDALIITAGARQRLCRGDDPKVVLCGDVVEAWRGRPTALSGLVVRNDLPEADRYQLVGIHIALHQERPEAMPFLVAKLGGGIALDPTEAAAMQRGAR
jgi:ABC-type phosphate/phosphonate transport system substrate-binding protein